MIPLVSLLFHSASLTERDDLAPGTGLVGRPVWGPHALLANLEMRLGLPIPDVTDAVRVQRWSRRLAELAAAGPRFYARSYEVDPVGTASALLAWRDTLVAAGWNGEHVPNAGARLETLAEVEHGADLRPGDADRLRRVEDELRSSPGRLFEALELAEPREAWPGRWRRVFALLEERGTPVRLCEVRLTSTDADTDLGRLRACLRGESKGSAPALRGDGSLVVLRAETSWELAHGLGALLRAWNEPSTAVIRGGDPLPLDLALTAQGLASQGVASTSAWRPALQVLPLAVELAFEPRDPYRVLELLTLPMGPFPGFVGHELARALSQAPGIGGRPWQEAKDAIRRAGVERASRSAKESGRDEADAVAGAEGEVAERLHRVAEWLETPGHDPIAGAPTPALLEVATRVRDWAWKRLVRVHLDLEKDPGDGALASQSMLLGSAFAQAEAFHEALSHESREVLDLIRARQLVDDVSRAGHAVTLAVEEAGRIAPVDHPGGLRAARDVVVWWHCVAGTQSHPSVQPWRKAEREALSAAGIHLQDPATRLASEAKSWRQAILAARKRLVLAMPAWSAGEALEAHPIWDEIVARTGATETGEPRLPEHVRELLEGRGGELGRAPTLTTLTPLSLPEARASWTLDGANLAPAPRHSASSLESLVGCPLQWVLNYRARIKAGRIASIPDGPILNGTLGHRLVELLHRESSLTDPARIAAEALPRLERLLREEAAVLLRPGAIFELSQLRAQLLRALQALSELLVASGLTAIDVESTTLATWRARQLDGRLDLLLRDADGRDVVLDLKWGAARYRDLLLAGRSIQLSVYASARRLATGAAELPAAGYFSLSRAMLLTTERGPFADARPLEGPKLSETWTKLENTVSLVEDMLSRGEVPVTGVRRSLPLIDAARVPESEQRRYLDIPLEAACDYCSYGSFCGQTWEGFV
jgi:ATP-dependent helicase/nuclease subunit B